ncbi:MAG: ABC transporter ATP-binding protein [Rhodospirillales bacterium]
MPAAPTMTSQDRPLLEASNLTSGYGKVRIVQSVDIAVRPGEILAVIGRNGVGKTTLMETFIGAIPPMDGRLSFKGQDITRLSPSKRARLGIGYVPQGRGMFARLSVADNLRMGERIGDRMQTSNYDRVFEFFPRLKERLPQKSGLLSGGEQQQLAIGRVLVGHPDLILLDEPSEGIQPNIVQAIGKTISRLRDEEGLTVVLVEQNLDLIHLVADRCVVIDKGTVVAELSAEEIRDPEVARRYLAI